MNAVVSNLTTGTYTLNYFENGAANNVSVSVPVQTLVNQNTVFNSGTISLTDPIYDRSASISPYSSGGLRNYDIFTFTPTITGTYNFTNSFPGKDGHASLYAAPFDPSSAATNFIIADDDGAGVSMDPLLTVALTAGQVYILVTTTFDVNDVGNYSWRYTGSTGAKIAIVNPVTVNLTGLETGNITNVSLSTSCNVGILAGPVVIPGPVPPTTIDETVSIGGSGFISSTSCVQAPKILSASGTGGKSNNLSYASSVNITIAFPALPTGAIITSIVPTISYITLNGSFLSELQVNITPPIGTIQTDIEQSSSTIDGFEANVPLGTWSTINSPVGNWLFKFRETYDDAGQDAAITNITITVTYVMPSVLEWYTSSIGGTPIGSSTTFNPVGVAGSGFANTNTVGTITYYAACSEYPACRALANFNVIAGCASPSTAASSVTGSTTICLGNTVNLSVNGGALGAGATWEWFSVLCGSAVIGTGSTITVSPTTTTDYFVRASAAGVCPATSCVSGTITLPEQGTTLGQNNESATCVVNQNNYIHFYHTSGRLLASINSLGQNLGSVSVTTYTVSPVNIYDCSNSSIYSTAMGRNWVITPQIQPTSPVNVILHYDEQEFLDLQTSANGNSNLLDDLAFESDLKLTKYSGPLNVDSDFSNNCINTGGSGGATLHSQSISGNTSSLVTFGASGKYTEFSISNFSEFWLHGSAGSPLPINLKSISGECNDKQINLKWITLNEINSLKFMIEKYRDLGDWIQIGEIKAAGNSGSENEYILTDENVNSFNNFYRLKQIDINGKITIYDPINVDCNIEKNQVKIYPNPSTGEFNIEINSQENDPKAILEIRDIAGKLLVSETIKVLTGSTLFQLKLSEIKSGTYFVNIKTKKENFKELIVFI